MFHNYNNNLDTPENRRIALTLADLEDIQRGYPSAYVESNPQPDTYYVKQRNFGQVGLGQGDIVRDKFASGGSGMIGATALHYPEIHDVFSNYGMSALESAIGGPATLMAPSGQYTGSVRMTPPISGGGRFIDSTTPIHHTLKYVQEERERGAGQNTFLVGKRGEVARPISYRTPKIAKVGKTLVMKGQETLGQIHDVLPKKRGRPKGGMKPLGSDPATYTPKSVGGKKLFKTPKEVGHEFKNPKEFVGGKKLHFIQRGESPKGCEMGILCGGEKKSLAKKVKSVAKKVIADKKIGKKITGKFAILNKVL